MNIKLSKKMKIAIIVIITAIVITLIPFEESQSESAKQPQNNTNPDSLQTKKSVEVKNFTKEDIARFTIASVMSRDPKKMTVVLENNLYYVSYTREDDKKQFKYKLKIEGNSVIWANIDGRWRNHELDEKITFEETGEKIKIIQTFKDGEKIVKQFNKGD